MWQSGGEYEIKVRECEGKGRVAVDGRVVEIWVARGLPANTRVEAKNTTQPQSKKLGRVVDGAVAMTRPGAVNPALPSRPPPPAQHIILTQAIPVAPQQARPPPPPIKKKPPQIAAKRLPMCVALYDYTAQEADELSFKEGDMIVLLSKKEDGWWSGSVAGRKGVFPANVRFLFAILTR